jgi:putative membrane protein
LKGVIMKRITIILILITLLIWCSSVFAAPATKEQDKALSLDQALQEILNAQGVSDIKSIDCSKVTEKQLEDLGDAFMDVMHPGSSEHDFMDRMMGGKGSPTLESMHRIMGARYLGCYRGDEPYGMMHPFWGGRGYGNGAGNYNRRWPPMMYGYGPYGQWGMMGPYGGIFMWILFLVILALVVYLVVRWSKPSGAGTGETPLDILKKRYAKGEITKDEFEQKKKDLGL